MQKETITISPSIMSSDLLNLEKSIRDIEQEGIDTLHVDIIDGAFSPSMPLGIDTVKQLRKITDINFDVHLMTNNNEFFIQEMIDIGVEQISFHLETSVHVDRYINLIRKSGAKVGVALTPSTPLSSLEYILPQVDTVLLMLINPGFATDKNENQVAYAVQKVNDLKKLIEKHGLNTRIEVDGRVSLETIPGLVGAGADILVAGSTSLFIKGRSLAENKVIMEEKMNEGLSQREEVK
ncbi:ribulose-phosphate 3-epimerase [Salisediminibacterium beveridgei]|uniref:Putative pentose isomerase n=1 Tax=Salisediminibacterium beveridgei TaxID=632773 RepID=A0A1D7QX17_9BACI|nr:ribulose-phosphate 3-epimerase [Salisediminibacterium beveridgei]AOM83553.1 Putative pentose isomerase [Salisediminibacterium beveridgei]